MSFKRRRLRFDELPGSASCFCTRSELNPRETSGRVEKSKHWSNWNATVRNQDRSVWFFVNKLNKWTDLVMFSIFLSRAFNRMGASAPHGRCTGLGSYQQTRNQLHVHCTSRLSPWMAIGCLSPRTVFWRAERWASSRGLIAKPCAEICILKVMNHERSWSFLQFLRFLAASVSCQFSFFPVHVVSFSVPLTLHSRSVKDAVKTTCGDQVSVSAWVIYNQSPTKASLVCGAQQCSPKNFWRVQPTAPSALNSAGPMMCWKNVRVMKWVMKD